jgi:hypothetical protein
MGGCCPPTPASGPLTLALKWNYRYKVKCSQIDTESKVTNNHGPKQDGPKKDGPNRDGPKCRAQMGRAQMKGPNGLGPNGIGGGPKWDGPNRHMTVHSSWTDNTTFFLYFDSKPIYLFDNDSKTQKYELPVEKKHDLRLAQIEVQLSWVANKLILFQQKEHLT